ncbi:hypothetical protein TNCV_2549431 [Trichonephila clavipes]|nr:hypothetical protein TNCV_2549431 [Trichonephila clavipes]
MSKLCSVKDKVYLLNVLDFDFEKLCSVSISRINVYACLVCGKYFQGRGTNTHAYMHSVQAGHHVFLNLQTLRFYCIPDNYEIIDSSLDDITYVLKPTFTKEEISILDRNDKLSRAYNGTTYMPGIVGLNNIKANDYCNVILQTGFESDPHVCRVRRPVPGESGVWGSCCVPFGPCFSVDGRQGEPAPVNRLVISSADSNTGSFGIPKTVALGLVLQLGVPWVNWRITSRTCTTILSTTSEVSAVPDACQMTGGLPPPCWAPWWVGVLE